MTSFRFNFSGLDDSPEKTEITTEEPTKVEDIQWFECVEVVADGQIENLDKIAARAKMFTCGDVEIGHVVPNEALLRMGDHGLKDIVELAEKEHSDLVKGKYEGGLKIWECTYDLIQYLTQAERPHNYQNLNVLDLGCGAGILGIYAYMSGARVTFQDYNKEVLECITIPNILLNTEEEDREFEIGKCKFYSGDWASFNKKLPDTEMFDIILTSETIYNPNNHEKLLDLFLQRLNKDGIVYVAAKTCYFGVGGGTREFEKCVDKNSLLKSEVCWKNSDGIQREIIKVTRNHDLFMID